MNPFDLQPLISIVTPSLNQAHFLSEALESVRGQTYGPIEHLVLDGGSNDGSTEVLSNFGGGNLSHSLWWRSSRDGGQSEALNEGFAKASGEIIGWLNADDRYRQGCFQAVAETFADHPDVDILYGDYTFINEAGDHIALRREIEFSRFILRYHKVLYIPTTATFFRRRIFDEGNFLSNELHYAMDLEFFLRLSDVGYKFLHLPVVLADFRLHACSKSVAFKKQQSSEHRSVILNNTPLTQVHSVRMRGAFADILQAPAALLRYSEKLRRGFYLPAPQTLGGFPSTTQTREQP